MLGGHLKKTILVVSTGRTGSKALAHYLNEAFTGVRALHEPRPSYRLRIYSGARLAGKVSPDRLVKVLTKARRRLVEQIRAAVYVESNPFLYGFVDVFPDVFERAKVVHVVRDPRTYIPSALNFRSHQGVKRLANSILPYWVIKPESVRPGPTRTWAQMTAVEWQAWVWDLINRHISQAARQYGDDYLFVRYKDLMRPDGSGIRKLADWIGAEESLGILDQLLKTKVNASRSEEVPSWDRWKEEDRQLVAKYCGSLMERYGYSLE